MEIVKFLYIGMISYQFKQFSREILTSTASILLNVINNENVIQYYSKIFQIIFPQTIYLYE